MSAGPPRGRVAIPLPLQEVPGSLIRTADRPLLPPAIVKKSPPRFATPT